MQYKVPSSLYEVLDSYKFDCYYLPLFVNNYPVLLYRIIKNDTNPDTKSYLKSFYPMLQVNDQLDDIYYDYAFLKFRYLLYYLLELDKKIAYNLSRSSCIIIIYQC